MTEVELRKLLRQGESETVEFKERFDREAGETAGAFANTRGGTVLIGVADSGKPVGLEVGKNTLKDIANQVSLASEPRIIPDVEVAGLTGRSVILLRVSESPLKPVAVRGRCYRRVGNSNRVMPPREVAEMHYLSTELSWDKLPARDATSKDISRGKVRDYIRLANAARRRTIGSKETVESVLEKVDLLKDGVPTWAAILLFRREPRRLLSEAMIHCGRFRGERHVIDDRMIDGTITEQVDDAIEFIAKNINVEFVITGRPAREQVWDYPLDALRETLINAVCHRDYTESSTIDVRIYDDRLEVWSPGGLPLGITITDLYGPHRSVLRNKGVAQVLFDIGWIERWGSGTGKIRDLCAQARLPEPEFTEIQQSLRVIFRKDQYSEEYLRKLGLSERQIAAVGYARANARVTNRSYQELNHVSRQTASNELSALAEKRILVRTGKAGRGIAYELPNLPNK